MPDSNYICFDDLSKYLEAVWTKIQMVDTTKVTVVGNFFVRWTDTHEFTYWRNTETEISATTLHFEMPYRRVRLLMTDLRSPAPNNLSAIEVRDGHRKIIMQDYTIHNTPIARKSGADFPVWEYVWRLDPNHSRVTGYLLSATVFLTPESEKMYKFNPNGKEISFTLFGSPDEWPHALESWPEHKAKPSIEQSIDWAKYTNEIIKKSSFVDFITALTAIN